MPDTADIVLFTVNDHETRETQAAFGANPPAVTKGPYRYWDYGEIAGARVVHALCNMADLPAGKVARAAMDAWQPSLLIAVGIAWGANDEKQNIGELLLAAPLVDAANHADRADTGIQPRGDSFPLSDALLQNLKSCHNDWCRDGQPDRPKLRAGEVISMPKLLDYLDERIRWLAAHPNAVGGEMEGRGMVDAAVERKCDWLLLKAICDWGAGKNANREQKKMDQALAAKNAATFLRYAVDECLGSRAVAARLARAVAETQPPPSSITMNVTHNSGIVAGSIGTVHMGSRRDG